MYVNEYAQVFCEKNAPYPACNDLGARTYMPNVAGAGAWAPLVNVTVFGSAAKTNAPYRCAGRMCVMALWYSPVLAGS